jgi:hypothetical protein
MNVFELTPDCNRYQNLVFTSKEDWRILDRFDGKCLLPSWTPLAVKVLRDDKFNRGLPPGDFPHLASGVPVFSVRAVNVLKRMLQENGEILPLSCSEGEYYAFNLTTLIDALDESDSEVKRFEHSGRIMRVLKYAFFPDKLHGATIFQIPQSRARIFVTDEFRRAVMDNNLVGFEFPELWEG